MKRKRKPKPKPPTKSSDPPNAFTAWPHQPEYKAVALIRKGGLWSVLELRLRAKEVIGFSATTETNFENAVDKAIRKLAQSVRR